MPDDIYNDGSYGENNPDWHGADAAWKAGQIARAIQQNNIEFKTCIEVGCGTGLVLENLAKMLPSKIYAGYDVSPAVQRFWSDRMKGLKFIRADFTTTDEDADLLLVADVIEHIPDYMGFLVKLSTRADWFVFHIPLDFHISGLIRDAQLHTRKQVGHLHYFSRATALATLKDCNFDIVSERFTKLSQETVEGRRPLTLLANMVRRALASISPNLAAKLLGGYSLLVVCRRINKGSAQK